jgi:hypothetical protein
MSVSHPDAVDNFNNKDVKLTSIMHRSAMRNKQNGDNQLTKIRDERFDIKPAVYGL